MAKIQSLVGHLRSHKPCQKKKKKGTSGHKAVLVALSQLLVCTHGGTKTPGKEEDLLGFSSFLQSSPLLPGGSGRCGDPGQLCPPPPHPQCTLAILRLAEALLLLREAVADTEASFNPPALPRFVPTNDAAAP